MAAKFTGAVLLATIIFSGGTALKSEAQTAITPIAPGNTLLAATPVSTKFSCVQKGNGFATIAQRGDRTTPPLIIWKSTLGGQYKPQERCNLVSQRLTKTVIRNGGKLRNLQLMAGPVKHQVVICVLNQASSVCNSSNMLFTLRPENAKRSEEVLASLNNFSIKGSGAPVPESNGLNALPLEELNRFLGPEDKTDTRTNW
jgi:hypothetical protein